MMNKIMYCALLNLEEYVVHEVHIAEHETNIAR